LKWQAASSGAPLVAGKNRIINGNMAIAQRRQTFTSTSGQNNDDAYTLDRWYILSDTNDVIDVTRATEAPTNGQFSIGLDVETANKKFGIAQIIEQRNCYGLIGQTVTLSFKAKVSSTTKLDNVKAAIVAWSGTADTVTSDIISAWNVEGTNPTLIANATYENTPANLNVTTSWATYSVSAAVDTASTVNIIAFIWSDVTDTTAGDFLYITDVQLEKGSSASDFTLSTGTVASEIMACQRYYEKTYELDTAPGTDTYEGHQLISGSTDAGSQTYHTPRFQVRKRGVPTISFWTNDGVSGKWGYSRNGASANVDANAIRISDNGFLCFANIGAAWVVNTWAGHWVAELEM
jgi:hypothetical protein